MCVINSLRMTAPSKKRSQPVRKTWGSPIGSFAAKSIPVLFEAADLGSSFNKANYLGAPVLCALEKPGNCSERVLLSNEEKPPRCCVT